MAIDFYRNLTNAQLNKQNAYPNSMELTFPRKPLFLQK